MTSSTAFASREALRARLEGADGLPDWDLIDVLSAAVAERLRLVGASLAGGGDDARGGASVLPHLAAAVREGRLSPDAFVLVRGALVLHPEARDAAGLSVDDAVRATPLGRLPLARVEAMTVDKAVMGTLRTVWSLVRQIEAGLTPPVVAEERYEELRGMRTAAVREESNGTIRLTALLDPLTAAPLLAAMDGYVKHAYRASVDHHRVDSRTPGHLRADALGWLGRHATGCERPHDAVKTTVVVRMTLADLDSGQGYGAVDGIATPLPVSVLRRHAADAQVIPTVLGARGELLDQGAAVRLFTRGQRRAIAERDRGCATCGLPPAYCDTHHVVEWQHGGSSDVGNGIMLRVRHHHMIHREKWRIRWRDGRWEFIPPASVDPKRGPVPGYQALTRLDGLAS